MATRPHENRHPCGAALASLALALTACGGGASTGPASGAASATPDDASGARGAGEGDGLRVGGTGFDFVSEKIRERYRVAGEGREPVTDVLRARLETSQTAEFPVTLEGGRCYVVLGVGVPSVRDLELYLVDEFGTTRGEDEVDDAFPWVRLCPRVDADWTVRLRAFDGYGAVGAQVFGGPE